MDLLDREPQKSQPKQRTAMVAAATMISERGRVTLPFWQSSKIAALQRDFLDLIFQSGRSLFIGVVLRFHPSPPGACRLLILKMSKNGLQDPRQRTAAHRKGG